MKTAIFSDLDGTLLLDNHQFSEETIRVVKEVQESGIPFVVTTGRLADDAIRQAKKLAIDEHKGYVLSNNGACAYSFKDEKFLWQTTFNNEELVKIHDFAYNKFKVHYFSNSTTYVYEMGTNSYYWSTVMQTKYKIIKCVSEIDEPITHASIIAYEELSEENAKEVINSLQDILPLLSITQYNNRVFEIICKGISKGSALRFLAHHLGVVIENTYAFGDSYNDLELIRDAGVGIAVDNAIDELKQIAKDIAKSNQDNGPVDYIVKHILNKKNKIKSYRSTIDLAHN